ncbi:hypothetical protein BLNAU_13056 [Blattamonas nauphoetae]|uniref:Uncharacterized protein n=1 Tax=Blattamonas nauphoetae TaxID=2049346 RepID=A0ABQ9XNY2_9EUKA|nr:hypothetical protein BLNAU_13056 [Blattamonas nauphoetae]
MNQANSFTTEHFLVTPTALEYYFDRLKFRTACKLVIKNHSSLRLPVEVVPPKSSMFEFFSPKQTFFDPGIVTTFFPSFTATSFTSYRDNFLIKVDGTTLTLPVIAMPAYKRVLLPPIINFGEVEQDHTSILTYQFESTHNQEYPFTIDTGGLHPSVTVSPTSGIIPSEGHITITISFTHTPDARVTDGHLGKLFIRGKGIATRSSTISYVCPRRDDFFLTTLIPSSVLKGRKLAKTSRLSSTSFRTSSGSSNTHSTASFSFSISALSYDDDISFNPYEYERQLAEEKERPPKPKPEKSSSHSKSRKSSSKHKHKHRSSSKNNSSSNSQSHSSMSSYDLSSDFSSLSKLSSQSFGFSFSSSGESSDISSFLTGSDNQSFQTSLLSTTTGTFTTALTNLTSDLGSETGFGSKTSSISPISSFTTPHSSQTQSSTLSTGRETDSTRKPSTSTTALSYSTSTEVGTLPSFISNSSSPSSPLDSSSLPSATPLTSTDTPLSTTTSSTSRTKSSDRVQTSSPHTPTSTTPSTHTTSRTPSSSTHPFLQESTSFSIVSSSSVSDKRQSSTANEAPQEPPVHPLFLSTLVATSSRPVLHFTASDSGSSSSNSITPSSGFSSSSTTSLENNPLYQNAMLHRQIPMGNGRRLNGGDSSYPPRNPRSNFMYIANGGKRARKRDFVVTVTLHRSDQHFSTQGAPDNAISFNSALSLVIKRFLRYVRRIDAVERVESGIGLQVNNKREMERVVGGENGRIIGDWKVKVQFGT